MNDPRQQLQKPLELRTNLHYINIDKEVKTMVLTSPSMEMESLLLLQTWQLPWLNQAKVLVWMQTLKPKVHHYFGVKTVSD